jgi:hypothetical protein
MTAIDFAAVRKARETRGACAGRRLNPAARGTSRPTADGNALRSQISSRLNRIFSCLWISSFTHLPAALQPVDESFSSLITATRAYLSTTAAI